MSVGTQDRMVDRERNPCTLFTERTEIPVGESIVKGIWNDADFDWIYAAWGLALFFAIAIYVIGSV